MTEFRHILDSGHANLLESLVKAVVDTLCYVDPNVASESGGIEIVAFA